MAFVTTRGDDRVKHSSRAIITTLTGWFFWVNINFDEVNEAEYYKSDGNGPPWVLEDEFIDCEKSLDEIKASEAVINPIPSKLVFLDNPAIDSLKVDELRQELEKRSLSKAGLKAELQEWLKKAMVDKIPVVDTAKLSAGPNNFDEGSR